MSQSVSSSMQSMRQDPKKCNVLCLLSSIVSEPGFSRYNISVKKCNIQYNVTWSNTTLLSRSKTLQNEEVSCEKHNVTTFLLKKHGLPSKISSCPEMRTHLSNRVNSCTKNAVVYALYSIPAGKPNITRSSSSSILLNIKFSRMKICHKLRSAFETAFLPKMQDSLS